jgi:uncharacterized surface protein with fasciclin (FAS1) repeats
MRPPPPRPHGPRRRRLTSVAAARDQDIVDTATAAGDFTALTKLLRRAGLVNAFTEPGRYNVFTPTDAVFAKVRRRSSTRSEQEEAAPLGPALPRRRQEADRHPGRQRTRAKTLNGKNVRFRVRGSNVYVNRTRVIAADVGAANGVIHAINRVLLAR